MDIYSKRGTKVVFTNEGGYDSERDRAAKLLTVGEVYTVRRTEVGSWRTEVELEEFPGQSFNSVQFSAFKQPILDRGDDYCETGDAHCSKCGIDFHYDLSREQGFYKSEDGVWRLECPHCLARNR